LLHLPPAYLVKYHDSASWVLSEGSSKKLGPTISVFPRLRFQRHLWEFNDGLYDLIAGAWVTDFGPFTSASIHHRYSFDELPFPGGLLAFLKELTSPSDCLELLVRLGSLFHVCGDRKADPALWIHGPNDSFKSWFLRNFLRENFSETLIITLDRQKGPFRYASLLKAEAAGIQGVIHSDDFRSADFRKEAGTMLNLLDGVPMVVQDKYLPGERLISKHGFVLSSNEGLAETEWSPIDRLALSKRFREVRFDKPSAKDEAFLEALLCEFPGLGLLCNYCYNRNIGREIPLPKSWRFAELGSALLPD
jgi:hypothetical protein